MVSDPEVTRLRYALGISTSIVSDAEVVAAAPVDENEAAHFLLDCVLGDETRLARLAQNLALGIPQTRGFLSARRSALPTPEPMAGPRARRK